MKKYEKYIYIAIIIILVGVVASGTTYIIMKDSNKNETKDDNKTNIDKDSNKNNLIVKTDGVELKKVYELNDKIIEEIEVTLNGKNKTLKIEYKYDYFEDILTHSTSGSYKDIVIYNKDIKDLYDSENDKIVEKYKKEDLYNIDIIKKSFDKDNFIIIKGKDNKNYLVVLSYYEDNFMDINEYTAYIFNEDLELISNNIKHDYYKESGSLDEKKYNFFNTVNSNYNIVMKAENISWYDGKYCIGTSEIPCHQVFKIENNKIYYLAFIMNSEIKEKDYGIIEEREYTINNNKLEYKIINTYKVTEMGNMI